MLRRPKITNPYNISVTQSGLQLEYAPITANHLHFRTLLFHGLKVKSISAQNGKNFAQEDIPHKYVKI